MTIVLILVAHKRVVLAEHAANVSGNFSDVAHELIEKQTPQKNIESGIMRWSVRDEQSGFNFHMDCKGPNNAYCFMCLASEEDGRSKPFKLLDELAQEFFLRYGNDHGKARAFSLNDDFIPVMKRMIKKYDESKRGGVGDSGKMDSIKGLRTELEDVKGSVQKNIHQVMERGAQLDTLVVQTESLLDTSAAFKQSATSLEQVKRWEALKFKLMAAGALALVLYLLLTRACGGFALETCI